MQYRYKGEQVPRTTHVFGDTCYHHIVEISLGKASESSLSLHRHWRFAEESLYKRKIPQGAGGGLPSSFMSTVGPSKLLPHRLLRA